MAGVVGEAAAAEAGAVAATAGAADAGGAEVAGCLGCLTSQASSSNPRSTGFSGAAGVEGVSGCSCGLDASFCSNTLGSTTSPVWTAGAGLLFRVLLCRTPPGPEKRPLGPPSSPLPIISSPPKLTFRALDLEPVRPRVVSKYRITRRISPSLRPRVRRFSGVISGRTLSSMESRTKF